MGKCRVNIEGNLPREIALTKAELKSAAVKFAEKSGKRVKTPFKEVSVILQDDEFSAEVHEAINQVKGATDVITQRYDAMPGEEPGIYGELYVNVDQALRAAPKREGWSPKKELLLYVAHGMDHLSGADDLEEKGYNTMRKRELGWLKELTLAIFAFMTFSFGAFAAEFEEEIIELDRWQVGASAKLLIPEKGRVLSGASLRNGYYLNEFWAVEAEAAMLERNAYYGLGVLWHWYGYERIDPFFTFGAAGVFNRYWGPKAGIGTFYHFTDVFALRLDADAMMDVDGETEMFYSLSLGIQYAF